MEIKFIYFDFNGVLAKEVSDKDMLAAYFFGTTVKDLKHKTQSLRKHPELDLLYRVIKNRIEEEHFLTMRFQILAELFRIEPSEKKLQQYLDIYMRKGHFALFEDTISTLKKLQELDIELGILSNSRPSRRTVEIERLGLSIFFPEELILLSAEIGFQKPEERYYKFAIDKSGHKAEEIIFIDDNKYFAKAASKYGMKGLHMGGDIEHISEVLKLV